MFHEFTHFYYCFRQEQTCDWHVRSIQIWQNCYRFPVIDSSVLVLRTLYRLLRDGSEVSRDSRTGDVLAEILLQSPSGENVPVLASFVAPWPLASGTVFDVECRNPSTGDGAFLAVTPKLSTSNIQDVKDTWLVDQLMGPTGRFSSYGTPTDIKIRGSSTNGNYRTMDVSFSTLSQSTQTELPRRARIVATIPEGTQQAVLLVGSASQTRWNQQSKDAIAAVTNSFRATPAPVSSLRLRAKERRS